MNNQQIYQHLKALIPPGHILCISLIFVLLNLLDIEPVMGAHTVKSPDGNVVITFDVKDVGDQRGCPVYSVIYNNQHVVVDSRLGFTIKDAPALEAGFNITSVTGSSNNNIYSPVYGERKTIRDHY
ncbi:MAG: glycoside hydrolase family 97 N-terminal domain-containing protein, partial [Planctomycetes bacterium]|nr:glycoside hydrolase family 97 N-terminal domain-containing protein [Planctomycetota bacterium]